MEHERFLWGFAAASVAIALLSFLIPGDLLAIVGTVVLPISAALFIGARSAPSTRSSLRIAMLTGAAYAIARIGVNLAQYYALGWRARLLGEGGEPPSITILSVVIVLASQLYLAAARVLVASACGLVIGLVVGRIRARRTTSPGEMRGR